MIDFEQAKSLRVVELEHSRKGQFFDTVCLTRIQGSNRIRVYFIYESGELEQSLGYLELPSDFCK